MLSGTGKKITLIFLIILILAEAVSAQSLSLSAELEQEQIWLGDSVQLTLFLQGSEDAISPKLQIVDVRVEPLGGTNRSSKSITNINGKVTRNISKAYVYGYKLTPKIAGQILIPSIELVVDGVKLSSRQILLNVKQPQQSNDFKLELDFDRKKVYLNEECRLKVKFIYKQSLRTLDIMIPGIESLSYEGLVGNGNDERYEININGSPVVFSKDDQGGAAGLSTELIISPSEAGALLLQNSSASFESVTGYQRVQDFWGRVQNQEVYGRTVISGNTASIKVLPFPDEGKPEDFFGLSGLISVNLSIEPNEVHIGDPITLNLTVSGMNSTDVKIPSLDRYLGFGIDLPETRSSARVEGSSEIITQTVRIKDLKVQQIPAIRFSYFNTKEDRYEYAESSAVPIKVLDTKVLTASELEGSEIDEGQQKKVLLEKKREGIYYNYSGSKLLTSDRIMSDWLTDSILIKLLLVIPPAVFIIILIYTVLLPQVRAQAEVRVDRSRAIRAMKKYAIKVSIDDANIFLKDFNIQLVDFLKTHGKPDDEILLSNIFELMNSVLYGRKNISADDARKAVVNAVEILQEKAV